MMSQSVKNFTFSLPINLLNKLKKYSQDGYVSSVNSAVKEALESYVAAIEKQDLFNQMKAAARDPLFIQDLEETMHDFSYPDFEATKEQT
jgi:metal-responsive CopG/Arc/MetJ family transcriptional regulator